MFLPHGKPDQARAGNVPVLGVCLRVGSGVSDPGDQPPQLPLVTEQGRLGPVVLETGIHALTRVHSIKQDSGLVINSEYAPVFLEIKQHLLMIPLT